MNKKLVYPILGATALLFANCGTTKGEDQAENKDEVVGLYTVKTDYFDKSVKPQEDFFQFANGTWIKENPVPASESRWGSFNELDKENKKKLTAILDEAKSGEFEAGSSMQMIGDYYAAMSDMESRNEQGVKTIENWLSTIDNINSKSQIPGLIASMNEKGFGGLFGFYVGQDLKDVEKHVPYISQGGLGLPNRDYYTEDSKEEIRQKYVAHITKTFEYLGIEDAAAQADKVMKMETAMAEQMMKPAALRIPENTYNPVERKEAIDAHPNLGLDTYFKAINIESFDSLIVGQPDYFSFLNTMIEETSLEDLKTYFNWKAVNHYAGYSNEDLVQMDFDFYEGVLSGKSEMKPMNERAIEEMTGKAVKTALAKEFVARHFSEEAKNKVNEMVDNLLAVYRERLENLSWMTDETKKEALIKLEAIGRKLGYPDEWKDLSSMTITGDNYIANVDACANFSFRENVDKLNEPVDKKEWGMPAHMVNAYYHPLLNEIAFPAGIMQPPFFDINAEDAVNYGGIGMVIGHEFTHGFDDMGSKFAADGSFTNWWSEEDRANFEKRTEKLGQTFSNFCPIDGHCVNPDLTMGENIADLGGITMAYHAYAMTDEFKSGEEKEGFTPAQRFFIAYAQLWKINYTDEELKKRLATDPHSPGMFRVNGPLMNCPEFFEAFDVQETDKMRNSEDAISKIW